MRKGIATPITLVVLMVVFTSLLAATGYMALGALRGGASERATYQAFTLAESALEALPLLVRCGRDLPTDYTLGPGLEASYRYPDGQTAVPPGGGTVRVQAVAQSGGTRARVERTFSVSCGFTGAIPAALTSRPRIEVRGDAQVIGQDFGSATGLLEVTTTSLFLNLLVPPSGSFTLGVQDATLIPLGSYVQIPTGGAPKTYRVEGKDGNTLTLSPLFTPGPTDLVLPGAQVHLVQFGVKSYGPPDTLFLNDARGLIPGQTIRVNGLEGTLREVDLATGRVAVEWRGPPPTAIPEGTPLVPQVLGAASALTMGTSGRGAILHGAAENSRMVPNDPDELFLRVFGMPKAAFLELYPPVSSFNGTLRDWEIRVVRGPLQLTGGNRLCGAGVLVVLGNLTVNGSCSQGFRGLIYVAGDYDQQGNAVLTGAVVVEGVADLQSCTGNECWTQIAGTGQGGGKIVYDPQVLQGLRVASGGTRVVAVPGTWRRL
ncbi:pilus assembly PilX N-terminal domain-containing protein [Thermus sediminis]|uniref:pilus assembly PilX N-terminal domain-containing protein n=1 Tax=Thermus sediminis TaxID=1761908 RepID=UPI000E3BE031|nr:pilus assembly PilX N-terminal domain-containing protein [Thermus sediminis]